MGRLAGQTFRTTLSQPVVTVPVPAPSRASDPSRFPAYAFFLPVWRRARHLSLLATADVRKSPFIEVHEDVLKAGERSAPPAIAFVDLCVVEHEFLLKIFVLHHSLHRVKHQKILYCTANGCLTPTTCTTQWRATATKRTALREVRNYSVNEMTKTMRWHRAIELGPSPSASNQLHT